MENIQYRLAQIREEEHLTKAQLAQRLKIHPQTWHKYESGISNMNIETLYHFCETMGVSSDFVLGLLEDTTKDLLERFYMNVIDLIISYEQEEQIEEDVSMHITEDIDKLYKKIRIYRKSIETK